MRRANPASQKSFAAVWHIPKTSAPPSGELTCTGALTNWRPSAPTSIEAASFVPRSPSGRLPSEREAARTRTGRGLRGEATPVQPSAVASGLHAKTLGGLSGDVCDGIEVLIQVRDSQA